MTSALSFYLVLAIILGQEITVLQQKGDHPSYPVPWLKEQESEAQICDGLHPGAPREQRSQNRNHVRAPVLSSVFRVGSSFRIEVAGAFKEA